MDAGHGCDVIDISMRSKQQRVLPSNGAVKFSRRRWGSDLPFDKQIDHCRISFSSQFGGKEKIWINRRNTDRCQISLCKIIHICRNQETRLGRDGVSKDLPVLRRRSEKPTCTFTNGAKLSPNRCRTMVGESAFGFMWRAASRSAVSLHTTAKPLSGPPTIKRVRVTGLTKTFASRKTRIGSSVTEQVCSYLAPADLNDVTHGRLPESLELLIWDLIPVSDFYRTQFSGSDFSRNRRSRHPG